MKRKSKRLLAVPLLAALACGGGPGAKAPAHAASELAPAFDAALREEMGGDDVKARDLYGKALGTAIGVPWDAHRVAGVLAVLDALAEGGPEVLSETTGRAALIDRRADTRGVLATLATDYGMADDPFTKGLLARTLLERAAERGDAVEAERWRVASGCAREATVVGPTDWATLATVPQGGPFERFDAPVEASYPVPGPFGIKRPPVLVNNRGCGVVLSQVSTRQGVRDVVVDADVKEEQDIGVALFSDRAAALRVGGRLAIERRADAGNEEVLRLARVHVPAGRVRLVVRAGDGTIRVAAWNQHGDPLPMHAPAVGQRATAAAGAVHEVSPNDLPAATNDAERVLFAAAFLAAGDAHAAERTLASRARDADAPPELLLLYARAVGDARDLDPVHRAERARAIYDRLLEKVPGAWEAMLAHAKLAAVRKGASEARIEALRDLDDLRKKNKPPAAALPLLDAFEAALAGPEGLQERADAALDRAKPLAGTPLLRAVERVAVRRSAQERIAFECANVPGADRGSMSCYFAQRDAGKLDDAAAELARLRRLRNAPAILASFALRDAQAKGDAAGVRAAYDVMLPGERTLSLMREVDGARDPAGLRGRLVSSATDAADGSNALAPLLLTLGDDPSAEFEGVAARLAAEDRKSPKMAQAATALLAHTERYEIGDDGLLRYVFFDVRRVSGTTDIEENAAARAPMVSGRQSMRVLRRRIHKRDGRVLEPDRNPNAQQGHAELAQLEQGDVVEALYQGVATPSDTGDVGLDTPDLLPERTAVVRADVELRLPASLKPSLWVHPILGKAQERTEGDKRVLHWALADHAARRQEEGVPRTDREVSIVMSTTTWPTVARAMHETFIGLEDQDDEVADWARTAATGHPPKSRELVEALVSRAGTAVREASGALLADFGYAWGRASSTTARTILVEHEGSRTWLLARALRDVGVPVDVGVAENEPFSADPSFPPRFSRFAHPLLVAHVASDKDPSKTEDVWIDADVAGPPLPAGRISPELRGRTVLFPDGAMKPAPSMSLEKERDEVDLRLVVDDKGDAKGDLTVLLRGRAAQQIAEALFRLVGFERQKALFGIALGWVPFANVDKVALSSSEGSWQIALRAEISVPGYAQPEDPKSKNWLLPGLDPIHYVFPRASVSTVAATYAGQSARESALSIRSAVQYHVHRRVELPAGAQVQKTPGPAEVHGPNLDAKRALSVAGNTIEDEFSLAVATGTVAPDRYGAFVDDARKTDDAFMATTRVKPPGK